MREKGVVGTRLLLVLVFCLEALRCQLGCDVSGVSERGELIEPKRGENTAPDSLLLRDEVLENGHCHMAYLYKLQSYDCRSRSTDGR